MTLSIVLLKSRGEKTLAKACLGSLNLTTHWDKPEELPHLQQQSELEWFSSHEEFLSFVGSFELAFKAIAIVFLGALYDIVQTMQLLS